MIYYVSEIFLCSEFEKLDSMILENHQGNTLNIFLTALAIFKSKIKRKNEFFAFNAIPICAQKIRVLFNETWFGKENKHHCETNAFFVSLKI